MSFNIFVKARPIRTAFILSESEEFDAVCDGLAGWTAEFWGARQSIIVLLKNDSLSDESWYELINFDPDNEEGDSVIEHAGGDTSIKRIGIKPVTSEEFKDGLEDLVSLNVLQMGMYVRCPRCRMQLWVRADALRPSDSCAGCGSAVLLLPETKWHYRLNLLVRHCVNSRALAVWQALAGLAHWPNDFFYAPSSELEFLVPIGGGHFREIDVLAVTNGKLLLGEVKDGDVERSDFEKFVLIAEAIRPDRAAIFIQKGVNVGGWFEEFRTRLAPKGISGELFELPTY
jgi:hypothetical protein